jgi:predicted NUDIX family NTP pyrophosphohydrolase
MVRYSAGLLPYRIDGQTHVLEVLLVHPGGPFWAKKDDGAWSIAKGELDEGEDGFAAAEREFAEELGAAAPDGERLDLGELRQPSGKRIVAWAVYGDVDVTSVTSNTFEIEWPPKSGMFKAYPEVDRAAWYSAYRARSKLVKGQVTFVDRLVEQVRKTYGPGLREGTD